MRIVLIADVWTPLINGVVTTLENTVRIARAKGHEVLLLHPRMFSSIPCPTYPEIRLALFPWRKAGRLLDAFRPEAIHIANEGPMGWSGRVYCRSCRLGFTTAYHTRLPEYIRLRFPVPLRLCYGFSRWFHSPSTCGPTPSCANCWQRTKTCPAGLKTWSYRYEEQFRVVFEAIPQLLATEEKPERKIGFLKEDAAGFGHSVRRKL